MLKKKYYSVYDDLRTGFFYKVLLYLGIILLILFILLKVFSLLFSETDVDIFKYLYELSQSSIADSIIAFSIVFIGLGIILYFFFCQFKKLAKIADELEKEETERKKNNKK
jgi:amino acid transporter